MRPCREPLPKFDVIWRQIWRMLAPVLAYISAGSKVRYRERFMRLWMLLQVIRNPSMFPAARDLPPAAEYSLLLPYFADALT